LDDESALQRTFQSGDCEKTIRTFSTVGPSTIGYSPEAEWRTKNLDTSAFDVLHQHGIWTAFSRVTRIWRNGYRRPTVVAPQGTLTRQALRYSPFKKLLAYFGYEKSNLHEATCLQATTEGEIESFRRFGLENPVAVIPNGVPDHWLEAAGEADRFVTEFSLPAETRIIFSLSRIHPKKGLALLLKAFGRTHSRLPNWHVIIAGPYEDESYLNHLTRLASQLDVEEKVHFVGPVYNQAKRDAFAAAELFVLPTLSDNFAITIAEALGAGVPVVTTHRALAWQVLEEKNCGWYVPAEPEALADALHTATSLGYDMLNRMGNQGRTLVRNRFLWSHIAEQTIELYRWLLGYRSRPSFVVL
jgi:glycosyltransferase involved in cell wall biosynthesis